MFSSSRQTFAMEYETERLLLKVLTPDYSNEVCTFLQKNSEQFEKYEPLLPANYYTPEHQHTILSCELKLALQTKNIRYYVFLKENPNQIIGTVALHNIATASYSSCEIGYKFDLAFQHKGYAREAVAMGVSIAFAALNLHRVYARVMPENTASIKLLESLFFEKEGLERECIKIQGHWQDHLRFALLNQSSNM
ncbi:MAG: GNAT family N-acetyltransferase [Roseburia sp.]|nr:GNAT family N-acetyltransferase [Roseburia sp.]